MVSVKRLSAFLNADELQADARKIVERPVINFGDEVNLQKHVLLPVLIRLSGPVHSQSRFFMGEEFSSPYLGKHQFKSKERGLGWCSWTGGSGEGL